MDIIKTIGAGKDYATWSLYYAGWLNTGSAFAGDNEISQIWGHITESLILTVNTGNSNINQQIIVTYGGNRHTGIFDLSKDGITCTHVGGQMFYVYETYFHIRDLVLSVTNGGSQGYLIYTRPPGVSLHTYERNIIKFYRTGYKTVLQNTSFVVKLHRNIVFGKSPGWSSQFALDLQKRHSNASEIIGNTVSDELNKFHTGIYMASSFNCTLKNNLVSKTDGASTQCYYIGGSPTTAGNLSSDATSPDVALRNKSPVFVDAANEDFHLDSTDTDAIDAGVNLGSTASIDIDLKDVSGITNWDIGAHEFEDAPVGGVGAYNKTLRSELMARDTKTIPGSNILAA